MESLAKEAKVKDAEKKEQVAAKESAKAEEKAKK